MYYRRNVFTAQKVHIVIFLPIPYLMDDFFLTRYQKGSAKVFQPLHDERIALQSD